MKSLYQLVEEKQTISEQAKEIENQRKEITKYLDTIDVAYTANNITTIRSLLSEDFVLEDVKRAYYLIY